MIFTIRVIRTSCSQFDTYNKFVQIFTGDSHILHAEYVRIIDMPQPTCNSIHKSLVKEAGRMTRDKNGRAEFKCRGRRYKRL